MIKGFILDVDGVLLDSMGEWKNLGAYYIESLGKIPGENLSEKIAKLTIKESAEYLKDSYNIPGSTDQIIDGFMKIIADFYQNKVQLKYGAVEFLDFIKNNGMLSVAATTSDKALIKRAFARLDIAEYFKDIVTDADAGAGKQSPEIYKLAGKKIGTAPPETLVVEDSLFALQTAKDAGFLTAAVYDECSERFQSQLKELSGYYAENLAILKDKLSLLLKRM